MNPVEPPTPEHFDVFLSYATDPDYPLARKLEQQLSNFHNLPGLARHGLEPLRVAFDQASFRAGRAGKRQLIEQEVRRHLAQSRYLLVLCSSGAARDSSYVGREVLWFLQEHGLEAGLARILIAVTEAVDPLADEERHFPAPIRQYALHRELIWFDLRGYRVSHSSSKLKVRDFDREWIRLACDLFGRSAQEIYPDWLAQQQQAARRRTRLAIIVAGVMALLAVAASFFGVEQYRQRQRIALLAEISEVRRQAAEATTLAPLKPEEGLRLAGAAWKHYGSLPAGVDTGAPPDAERARARMEVLRALFGTLQQYPSLRGSLTSVVRGDGAVLASDQGDHLVVVGARPAIQVWQRNAEITWNLSASMDWQGTPSCLALNAQGTQLMAADRRWLRIWQLDSQGRESAPRTIDLVSTAHANFHCSSAAFDHDVSWVVLGSVDGTLWRLSIATLALERLPWQARSGQINDLQFDRTGQHLLVADWSNATGLTRIALASGAETILEGISAPPRCLADNPETGEWISGHEDGTLGVWNAEGVLLASVKLGSDPIIALARLPDGRLAVGDEGGMLALLQWNGTRLKQQLRQRAHRTLITGIASLAHGAQLVTTSPSSPVRIWDLDASAPLEKLLAQRASTGLTLSFDRSGASLVAAGRSALQFWSSADGKPTATHALADPAHREISALAQDSTWLALTSVWGDPSPTLYLAALAPSGIAPEIALQGFLPRTARLAFSPASQWLAAGNFGDTSGVRVWKLGEPRAAPRILGASVSVNHLTFSHDERFLAATDMKEQLHVWDLQSGARVWQLQTAISGVGPIAFHPEGGVLALGSISGAIAIADPASDPKSWLVLDQHRASISALAYDPSGQWLLSASTDGQLLLWDTNTWQVLGEIHDQDGSNVRELALSPDGKHFAALSQGGLRVSIWSLDPEHWARMAAQIAGERGGSG